jgi:hypothetical protein
MVRIYTFNVQLVKFEMVKYSKSFNNKFYYNKSDKSEDKND